MEYINILVHTLTDLIHPDLCQLVTQRQINSGETLLILN